MSRYWIDILLEYRCTRLPHVIYVPLAIFLATAAYSGADNADAGEWFFAAVLCYGLVVQFRLWDDLADIEEDRLRDPGRLLCRLQSTSGANRLLVIVSMVVLPLVLYRNAFGAGSWVYFALLAITAAWYGGGSRGDLSIATRSRIQLCKYPLFVLIVAPAPWPSGMPWLAVSMLMVYLSFVIFEFLDDDRIAVGKYAGAELGAYLLFISVLWFVPLVTPGGDRILPGYVFAALMLAAVALLAVLYRQRSGGGRPAALHYSIFVASFLSVAYSGSMGAL